MIEPDLRFGRLETPQLSRGKCVSQTTANAVRSYTTPAVVPKTGRSESCWPNTSRNRKPAGVPDDNLACVEKEPYLTAHKSKTHARGRV